MALTTGSVVRLSAIMRDARLADVINTYDVLIDTVGDGGDDGFKVDAAQYLTAMYGNVDPYIIETAQCVSVGFYERAGPSVLTPIAWAGPTFTDTSQELPYGTSALIYGRTERRHTLTRKYLGPFGESINNAGGLHANLVSALEGFIGSWLGPFTGDNNWEFHPVCWSTVTGGPIEILEGVIGATWAIQRRRRIGRGS
jgi:hypothetical protein